MEKRDRNKEILTALQRNYQDGRLHHAYIFSGPVGAGKLQTALEFAAYLFAESEAGGSLFGGNAPRDAAQVLERISRSGHPDLVRVQPQDGVIRVDDTRELLRLVSYAPLESKFRVVILEEADAMQVQAANAILKLLEEPPGHTIFFLLVPDANLLLQTIRSRCQILRFFPLTSEVVLSRLAEGEFTTAQKTNAVHWAEGSLKRANRFLQDEDLQYARDVSRTALLDLWNASPRVPSASLKAMEELNNAERAATALDTWYSLSRDLAVLLENGKESLPLYHEDARGPLMKLVEKIRKPGAEGKTSRELADKCAKLHRLRVAFDFHVNQKLALDKILCDLQLFSIEKN